MIYFAINSPTDPTECKIGHTTRYFEERLKELHGGPTLVGLMPGGRNVEKQMHTRFKSTWFGVQKSFGREWFRWEGAIQTFVESDLQEMRRLGGQGWEEVEKDYAEFARLRGLLEWERDVSTERTIVSLLKECDELIAANGSMPLKSDRFQLIIRHLARFDQRINTCTDLQTRVLGRTISQSATMGRLKGMLAEFDKACSSKARIIIDAVDDETWWRLCSDTADESNEQAEPTAGSIQDKYQRPASWPYISLRVDVRWLPESTQHRPRTLWLSQPEAGGARQEPLLYYRLSATVYGRLLAAVEKLEQPTAWRDEVTRCVRTVPPSAQALASAREAVRLMMPLYEFLVEQYGELAVSEGAAREEGWQALSEDIEIARAGKAKLPEPDVSVAVIRMLERIGD